MIVARVPYACFDATRQWHTRHLMATDEQLTAANNALLANRDAVLADATSRKGDAFAAERR